MPALLALFIPTKIIRFVLLTNRRRRSRCSLCCRSRDVRFPVSTPPFIGSCLRIFSSIPPRRRTRRTIIHKEEEENRKTERTKPTSYSSLSDLSLPLSSILDTDTLRAVAPVSDATVLGPLSSFSQVVMLSFLFPILVAPNRFLDILGSLPLGCPLV